MSSFECSTGFFSRDDIIVANNERCSTVVQSPDRCNKFKTRPRFMIHIPQCSGCFPRSRTVSQHFAMLDNPAKRIHLQTLHKLVFPTAVKIAKNLQQLTTRLTFSI